MNSSSYGELICPRCGTFQPTIGMIGRWPIRGTARKSLFDYKWRWPIRGRAREKAFSTINGAGQSEGAPGKVFSPINGSKGIGVPFFGYCSSKRDTPARHLKNRRNASCRKPYVIPGTAYDLVNYIYKVPLRDVPRVVAQERIEKHTACDIESHAYDILSRRYEISVM